MNLTNFSFNPCPKKDDGAGATPAQAAFKRTMIMMAFIVALSVGGIACVMILFGRTEPVKPAAATSDTKGDSVLVEFEKLKGKWVRPDGGYVLELRRLIDQNALEAGYFNPNPIHVGSAKLYKERGFVKVFVELQDVNYPGSTYTLIYDAANDLLRGIYYQATQQQEYEIYFERMPPGN